MAGPDYEPPEGYTLIPDAPGPGWLWTGGVFSKPALDIPTEKAALFAVLNDLANQSTIAIAGDPVRQMNLSRRRDQVLAWRANPAIDPKNVGLAIAAVAGRTGKSPGDIIPDDVTPIIDEWEIEIDGIYDDLATIEERRAEAEKSINAIVTEDDINDLELPATWPGL